MAEPETSLARRRHFLFLQGMPSAFFRRIAQRLREHGHRCTRINLCLGDRLFWHGPDTLDYSGDLASWPRFLETFLEREGVTDLLLLGEQRHYHREAVHAALARGIAVTVTDFGYIRPDWITFERNGMSGASLFPRDPAEIRVLAAASPEPDWTPRFHDSGPRMAAADLLYNFANLLPHPRYAHYQRSDRRPPTLRYTFASARRLLANRLLRSRMQRMVQSIEASGRPYYVFPLQLDFDFQIVAYSPYPGIEQAIEQVLQSFARHAPPEALLVLKEHPWDPALRDWERVCARVARGLGLGERVHYLRGGYLDTLIRGSAGVVTVNSTSGLRTLQLGRPLQVLGQAVYDVPGLSFQQGLDRFWTEATEPDPELTQELLRALAGCIQIRGVFFQEPGLSHAVHEAVQRLLQRRVGLPLARG
jgi:capsular polysaccharide export protein